MSLSVIHIDRPQSYDDGYGGDGDRMSIIVETEEFANINQLIEDYIVECTRDAVEINLNDIGAMLDDTGLWFEEVDNFYLHELEAI
jgi:hypothetical protein